MVKEVALNLMHNNLALKAEINGFKPSTFNLNPDYAYQDRINSEEWARVDDFPANLLAAGVDYSDRLAAVLARFQPPALRGGEALRALMMFQTAANITDDAAIVEYLDKELLMNRKLHRIASDTSQLLADVIYGLNEPVVNDRREKLVFSVLRVLNNVLAMTCGVADSLYCFCEPVFTPFVSRAAAFISGNVSGLLEFMRSRDGFAVLALIGDVAENSAETMRWLKANRLADRLQQAGKRLHRFSVSSVDEFADTMRSYVGCNLGFFAMLGILEQPGHDETRNAALAVLPRAFAPIADEGNSLYTFIEAAFTGRKSDGPLLQAARKTLALYPESTLNRRFDHSRRLRVSVWPDRFGRYGRQSVEVIPVNLRAPHVFIWQEPPRMLITGDDDNSEIAPAGYLLAYWFGRLHGFISAGD
jgi:hypothetical protein